MVDVFLELIGLLPKKAQWVISAILAAALIGFLAYLVFLFSTGNLW